MPKHRGLSLRKLVYAVPWDLFERYFKQLQPETKPNPWAFLNAQVLEDFLSDPENVEASAVILEDFQRINDICGRYLGLLIRAYERADLTYDQERPPLELAMRLFLDAREAFEYAWTRYLFLAPSGRLFDYRFPAGELAATDEQVARLQAFLRGWFASAKHGSQCEIARFKDLDSLLIRISRGLRLKTISRWRGNEVMFETFRPASEDVITYEPATSRLSIMASTSRDRERYVRGIAEHIAGDPSLADRAFAEKVFSLEPIQADTFDYTGGGVVSHVTLTEAHIKLRTLSEPVIIIKSDNVRRTLEEEIEGFSLQWGDLKRVKLLFELRLAGDKRPREVTLDIEPPGYSDLAQKAYAEVVAAYLKEQGVKLI
jgi:hypothetical protein